MALTQFTLANICELDGGVAAVTFEQLVRRAALDCMDRPGDGKARKITLEVTLIPRQEQCGDCTEVEAQVHAKCTVPPHRTKPYSFGLRKNGVLVFNSDSPDNVNQTTLLDDNQE